MMKLLLGGSPCTHWSIAQSRHREVKPEGLGWELFRNYLIAKERYCPDYFLYENNKSMAPAIREQITAELGVEPILINSALVSAQNRQRLYWTNIPGVEQPMDRGLVLRDILESGLPLREKGYTLKANYANANAVNAPDSGHFPATMAAEPVNITADGKAHCLRSSYYKDGIRNLVGNACDRKTCAAQSVGINRLGGLYGQDSRWGIYDAEGKCPCLTASAGMGGGHVPMYPVPVCVNSKSGRGEIAGVQPSLADRVYSIDGKGTAVTTAFHPHIAVPASTIRIGTIESSTGSEGQGHRVYSADGKSKTLCGNGGGAGAKTGLYTVPCAGRMVGRRINEQGHRDDYNEEIERFQRFEVNEEPQKTNCLSTVHKDNLIIQTWDGKTFPVYEVLNGLITIKGREYPIRLKDGFYIIRKLTVLECMRLQTVPEDYIFPVSNSQAYKMLGNGWTVDVIAHILSYCPGILSEPLEVLSMYDGMSCGHLALDKLGAQIIRYYATEIDKYAIKTTMTNYPDTIQLGDAFGVRGTVGGLFFIQREQITMRDYKEICGFSVKIIPQKPDYLPISQEEFVQKTLEAWTHGDEDSRISAVFRGGAREWEALWNDESYTVRGVVAYFASEEYQLKLVYDPITPVRDRLAIYGTDKVRLALLERGEPDKIVMKNIAKYGNITVRHRLVQAAWDKPDILFPCVRYLPASDLEKLLGHPRMDIRMEAALHGSIDQCSRVLAMTSGTKDFFLTFMRDDLIERRRELEKVDNAINFGKTITRKKQEMELST